MTENDNVNSFESSQFSLKKRAVYILFLNATIEVDVSCKLSCSLCDSYATGTERILSNGRRESDDGTILATNSQTNDELMVLLYN